jgi:hypothetical protein
MITEFVAEFTDTTHEVICGIFSSLQSEEWVTEQEWITAKDPRYKVWWDNLLIGTMTGNLSPPIQSESE